MIYSASHESISFKKQKIIYFLKRNLGFIFESNFSSTKLKAKDSTGSIRMPHVMS